MIFFRPRTPASDKPGEAALPAANGPGGAAATIASPGAQPAAAAATPPRQQLNRAAAFGEIVSLLMRSRTFQALPLRDLRWLVLPPLKHGHVALAEARTAAAGSPVVPIGAVLWAKVSPEVISRIVAREANYPRLDLPEWLSGDIVLVTTAVGHPRALTPILSKLRANEWAGRRVVQWVRQPDGRLAVVDLSPELLAAATTGARART